MFEPLVRYDSPTGMADAGLGRDLFCDGAGGHRVHKRVHNRPDDSPCAPEVEGPAHLLRCKRTPREKAGVGWSERILAQHAGGNAARERMH